MAPSNGAPAAYTGFDHILLAGTWRAGRSGRTDTDTDPYTGDVLTELTQADTDDLDVAYRAARDTQREWSTGYPLSPRPCPVEERGRRATRVPLSGVNTGKCRQSVSTTGRRSAVLPVERDRVPQLCGYLLPDNPSYQDDRKLRYGNQLVHG